MLRTKIIVLLVIGIVLSGSIGFVWAQELHWHHLDDCFEIGKMPKVEKFGKNGQIVSCVSIKPFEK